jgi:hypothetical protein
MGTARGQLNISPASDRQLARLPSVRNQDASLSRVGTALPTADRAATG